MSSHVVRVYNAVITLHGADIGVTVAPMNQANQRRAPKVGIYPANS